MVSVADGGSLTVGESQLVGVDGSSDPFPCDGTLPDCVGVHVGTVDVAGPAVMAAEVKYAATVSMTSCP